MNYLEVKKCSKNPGIYLIQNNINGKPYVGQAIKLRKRLLQHINHKEEDYPLYRAFHKYGIENFTFSILEELEVGDRNYNDIKKDLDRLEIFYIDKFDSYRNGYNQTLGGDGGVLGYKMTEEQRKKISNNANPKKVACKAYNISTKEIITFNSETEASETLKTDRTLISKRLTDKSKGPIKGFLFFKYDVEDNEIISPISNIGNSETIYSEEEFREILDNNILKSKKDIPLFFNISEKTFYNYLNRWKIKSPFNTKDKIAFIVIEDIVQKVSKKSSIKEISNIFGITENSARKLISRSIETKSLYKKRYLFYKYIQYEYGQKHHDEDENLHHFKNIKTGDVYTSIYSDLYSLYYIMDDISNIIKID